jgi:hypothetical protein
MDFLRITVLSQTNKIHSEQIHATFFTGLRLGQSTKHSTQFEFSRLSLAFDQPSGNTHTHGAPGGTPPRKTNTRTGQLLPSLSHPNRNGILTAGNSNFHLNQKPCKMSLVKMCRQKIV